MHFVSKYVFLPPKNCFCPQMIRNKMSLDSQLRVNQCFNSAKTFFLVKSALYTMNTFLSLLDFGGKISSSFREHIFTFKVFTDCWGKNYCEAIGPQIFVYPPKNLATCLVCFWWLFPRLPRFRPEVRKTIKQNSGLRTSKHNNQNI